MELPIVSRKLKNMKGFMRFIKVQIRKFRFNGSSSWHRCTGCSPVRFKWDDKKIFDEISKWIRIIGINTYIKSCIYFRITNRNTKFCSDCKPCIIIKTPVDHTRILLQMQKGDDNKNKYHGSLDAGVQIYKKYGIKGLYLGFYPTLLR